MSEETRHAQYPERHTVSVTVHGNTLPGWFSGPAAIWTGGSSPRIIGPFDSVTEAMKYLADHAPGAQIFPYEAPKVSY
jgi:hypothetical protein